MATNSPCSIRNETPRSALVPSSYVFSAFSKSMNATNARLRTTRLRKRDNLIALLKTTDNLHAPVGTLQAGFHLHALYDIVAHNSYQPFPILSYKRALR